MFTNQLLENAKDELSFRTLIRDIKTKSSLLQIVLLNPNSWCYSGYCVDKASATESSIKLDLLLVIKVLFSDCGETTASQLRNLNWRMFVAQAQAEKACNMRNRLNDEDYVSTSSATMVLLIDVNAKTGKTPKRTAAAIVAEVADKLVACSSSQMIMHYVLSTFAVEEAKNAEKSMPVADSNFFMPAQALAALINHSYQSVLVDNDISFNPVLKDAPKEEPAKGSMPSKGIASSTKCGSSSTAGASSSSKARSASTAEPVTEE
ncbi:hypothetical protein REPUB_Repub07fG0029300 [Reevesia pubescens]